MDVLGMFGGCLEDVSGHVFKVLLISNFLTLGLLGKFYTVASLHIILHSSFVLLPPLYHCALL